MCILTYYTCCHGSDILAKVGELDPQTEYEMISVDKSCEEERRVRRQWNKEEGGETLQFI